MYLKRYKRTQEEQGQTSKSVLKRGERAEPCYREKGGQGVQVSPGAGQVGQTQADERQGRQKDEGEHKTAQTQREKTGGLLLEADWLNLLGISLTVLFSLACRADAAESSRRNCKL